MADKHTNLIVSSSPHVCNPADTANIMRDVVIALMPALGCAIYVFGLRALLMTVVCAASCVFFEWAYRKALKKEQTIGDWSAVVTGVILAFNLPAGFPIWMAIICGFGAIFIGKQLFGGLGQNFANPAIVGRIVLFVAFATYMTTWPVTSHMSSAILSNAGADAMTGATPLALYKMGAATPTHLEMFLGYINGSMGEISALALLIGGCYLVWRKVISPAIPLSFLASVAVFSLIFGRDPLFDLCAGGVMLGAIFMATDYVTSPITTAGRIIFGCGCGLITMLIRNFGAYPEGASFAILLMNIITPHIDVWTRPHINGVPKAKKGGAK